MTAVLRAITSPETRTSITAFKSGTLASVVQGGHARIVFLLQALAPVLPHGRQADASNRLDSGLERIAPHVRALPSAGRGVRQQLFEDPFTLRAGSRLRSLEPLHRTPRRRVTACTSTVSVSSRSQMRLAVGKKVRPSSFTNTGRKRSPAEIVRRPD
jgi:hypothetical protein